MRMPESILAETDRGLEKREKRRVNREIVRLRVSRNQIVRVERSATIVCQLH